MEPIVKYHNTRDLLHAKVYPFGDEASIRNTCIDIYRNPRVDGSGWEPGAHICWPACAGKTQDAVTYAGALMRAVTVAFELQGPIQLYEVTGLPRGEGGSESLQTVLIPGNTKVQVGACLAREEAIITDIREIEDD